MVASGVLFIALATSAWATTTTTAVHKAPEVNPMMLGIEAVLAAAGVTVLVLARRRKKES
jgi:hypothetical protein